MLATLVLGWAVGRDTTAIDSWFHQGTRAVLGGRPGWLLIFTSGWTVLATVVASLAITVHRRQWALSAAVLACPVVATALATALKHAFDRRNGPYLEYPSGHTTLLVTALGMLVVVAAARAWVLVAAVVIGGLGALGLVACGYHYLTDTIGAALLSTALVCGAARLTSAV
ncbi:hypothetical protein KIH27_04035 [Mycobacterium sp. M1]|uniref:Phosphatidic acid phosphatase type 2/haloperoxidase domain-containing protein n=1 Tax=Mycolicibacter acidiphilus TaxID=2835306 RepID=A0ABS5REQ6_9MYCO|nr:phosphatase PAP2 family protein [Mycolicibacter acidiphilus]MBS9532755.1 hypothetical protein [Mycolicibacter acidiphilus]